MSLVSIYEQLYNYTYRYIIIHSKDKRVEFQTSSQLKCLHNDKYKKTWLKQKQSYAPNKTLQA